MGRLTNQLQERRAQGQLRLEELRGRLVFLKQVQASGEERKNLEREIAWVEHYFGADLS
jgi:hypothetical protein